MQHCNHQSEKLYIVTHCIGTNPRGKPIMAREVCDDIQEAYDYAEWDLDKLHEVLEIDRAAGTSKDITRWVEIGIEEAAADARALARHNASFARPSGY